MFRFGGSYLNFGRREPTIVSCCGYSFCQICIEQIQVSGKTCPLCSTSEFSSVPDKRLQRQLSGRQVWCVKKEAGCEWAGELGKLNEHLNVAPKPAPKRRLEGCAFIEMECSMCHELFQRKTIVKHENDQCPQRPYSCSYCKEHKASFRDVVNKHYPICRCYPLPCPNKCDELPEGFKYMIERQNLEHHLKEDCILTVVECDFHYAGCGVKLPRKDMAGHLAGSLVAHMSLLAVYGKKAIEERDRQISRMQEEIKEERDKMQEKIEELERGNRSLKDTISLHSHLCTPPVTFTMTNFGQHKRNKDKWYSPPFYTHPHGYKMCIKVVCEDEECSVATVMMRGEFDKFLHWPFQSDVYIRILNQLSDDNHITITGDFSCDPTPDEVGVRDEHQPASHCEDILYTRLNCHGDSTGNCQYLRDDCIQLQVARVVDTVQLQREIVATVDHRSVRTPPCQFIMRDFEQHKKGCRWYSPSFFTHPQGYRMCLCVDANGCGRGRETHVSVCTSLMCGEFDSHLKWPFRGDITIQLLNQLEDNQHCTKTINYTDTTHDVAVGQVTVGERGYAWGKHQFIPHSELGFNPSRNCKYLKDGCIIFKITKIDLKI